MKATTGAFQPVRGLQKESLFFPEGERRRWCTNDGHGRGGDNAIASKPELAVVHEYVLYRGLHQKISFSTTVVEYMSKV